MKLVKHIPKCICNYYFTANQHIIFAFKPMLKSIKKDGLHISLISSLIYQFKYQSKTDCINKTTQLLEKRISQHIAACTPKDKFQNSCKCSSTSGSANSKQFINN